MKKKDRNRRRFLGGGAEEGPVFAVPVPVGGRFPVFVDGDGAADLTSAGVGGVGGGFGGSLDER